MYDIEDVFDNDEIRRIILNYFVDINYYLNMNYVVNIVYVVSMNDNYL